MSGNIVLGYQWFGREVNEKLLRPACHVRERRFRVDTAARLLRWEGQSKDRATKVLSTWPGHAAIAATAASAFSMDASDEGMRWGG